MTKRHASLHDIGIASPCSASWEGMTGDDRKRFCGDCKLNVYNISAMSQGEAEDLIRSSEGRLCVRFMQREDGTIITKDCPVGLRRRMRMAWARCAALLGVLFGGLVGCTLRSQGDGDGDGAGDGKSTTPKSIDRPLMGEACPVERMGDVLVRPSELLPTPAQPAPQQVPQPQALMGKVQCTPPKPRVKPVQEKQ